ncbi:hypothetical protein GE09DRAFT_1266572 [Coniochaeta sp. 2T2.1]|nr:hypothetical protein GE09DRAFT_1266572 [Coniochaeta sp. 2T2.1]
MSSSSITIPETERDAKLRVTAYHGLDLNKKVISFQPGVHERYRIRPIISSSFPKTHLSPDLGPWLKHLPPEILVKIFLNLDIASIFTLRQTNGALRAFVTSIPEYGVLSTDALDAYLAIHRTNLAPWLTLHQVHRALISEWCTMCGAYGGFLFLPTAMRCCLRCICDKHTFQVLSLNLACRMTNFGIPKLQTPVPTWTTIPGWYGKLENTYQKKVRYVSFQHAFEAALETKGPAQVKMLIDEVAREAHRKTFEEDKARACVAIPTYEADRKKAYWGLSCRGCAMKMPRLNATGRSLRSGCKLPDGVDTVYEREEFEKHVEGCENAKWLWEKSEGGKKCVRHLEGRFSVNGGFFESRMIADGEWGY